MTYPADFKTIQDSVIAKIRIRDTAVNRSLVKDWINRAYAEAAMETQAFQKAAYGSLTAGQPTYALPTEVIELKSVIVRGVSEGSFGAPLRCVTRDEILDWRQNSAAPPVSGPASAYALLGLSWFELYPTPTSADVVQLYYSYKPEPLVADADVPLLEEPWSAILEYGALKNSAEMQADDLLPQWAAEYEDHKSRLRRHVNRRGGFAEQIPTWKRPPLAARPLGRHRLERLVVARPRSAAPRRGGIAPQTMIEADFSKGVVKDADAAILGPGQVVASTNFMHDKVVPYKRGGTNAYGFLREDASHWSVPWEIAYAEFPRAGEQEMVAFGESDAGVAQMFSLGARDSGGSMSPSATPFSDHGYFPGQRPVMVPAPAESLKGALVWGIGAGNDLPRVYLGSATNPRAIAGTGLTATEGGRYTVYYKSRLVLASSTTYENRMWFSPAGSLADIETAWDLTASWIDFDFGITGLAALQNVMLVFSRNHVERLTGDIPPTSAGVTDENMNHGPLMGGAGCTSARSIAFWKDSALWANGMGVFMSNGTGVSDLTAEGGIIRDWREGLGAYNENSDFIAGEVMNNYYFVAVTSETASTMWICDIPRRAWWRIEPSDYVWFAANPSRPGEIYGTRSRLLSENNRALVNLGTFFQPGAGVDRDEFYSGAVSPVATFEDIEASMTTRILNGGQVGLKAFRGGRMLYSLESADHEPAATLTVTGEAREDEILSEVMPEVLGHRRVQFDINATDQGVQYTIEQTSRCDSFRLYGFETDYRPLPLTRGGSSEPL